MISIYKLNEIDDQILKLSIVKQIEDIFFLSSSIKEFSSEEKRQSFFKRWCGDYIYFFPNRFFLMMEKDKLYGYLSACNDSQAARLKLQVPGFEVFSDLFIDFPAHLHINFHPDSRGMGLGSKLVDSFCRELSMEKSMGVHLVTSPEAKNVSFYRKLGFNHEIIRPFNNSQLLFMGKKLTPMSN